MATRVHLKPTTVASYEAALRSRVLPRWGSVPVARVTHGDVAAWVAELRAEGLSAGRVRYCFAVLRMVLDAAIRDGRLARNPAAGVELPRLAETERRYLTHGQVSALAEACGPYRALVLTLAYTGLRWGEAAALRVRRVDPLRGRIAVVEAMTEVHGRAVFGTPKTHAHRSVPVPRFLRNELAAAMAGKEPEDLVFTSARGAVLRVGNVRRRGFDAGAHSVGLDGLRPHELRHTAASLAIASGANVKAVQRMLGHASATLTWDRYGHLYEDDLDAVAERLDAAAAHPGVPRVCPEGRVVPLTQRETGT